MEKQEKKKQVKPTKDVLDYAIKQKKKLIKSERIINK